jgi:hypothetical protein
MEKMQLLGYTKLNVLAHFGRKHGQNSLAEGALVSAGCALRFAVLGQSRLAAKCMAGLPGHWW